MSKIVTSCVLIINAQNPWNVNNMSQLIKKITHSSCYRNLVWSTQYESNNSENTPSAPPQRQEMHVIRSIYELVIFTAIYDVSNQLGVKTFSPIILV